MKILQLINKHQNRGAETFACQLSGHLVKMNHEIKLVTIFKGEANLPYDGEILCLKASEGSRFIDYRAWKSLASIIRTFQPDVIQANAGDTLKYAVFSKLLFNWKQPILFRNASEVGRYLNSSFQKRYNSFLYRKVDRVASVSKVSEKDLLQHFPFLKGKTEVLPIGLEPKKQTKQISLEPKSTKHIIHVGGFSFEKNHKGLLRIFSMVLEKKTNIHLHLVGDGPMRKEIEEEVRKLNLQNNITFYGFVNNPLSFIEAADVLVLPSIIEGLPGVLLEAMYCKKPVVAYNVGGISEIVNRETGVLIDKGDESSFYKAILQSLNSKNADQINAAYSLVTEHFMNKEIALKFVNSYRKIVSE